MKVFVLFQDLGYDGCIEPEKVFSTKEKAELYISQEKDAYFKDTYRIVELELE